MQNKKFLAVIGVATVLSAVSQGFAAPDSEAQAKMREALRQKMEQLKEPAPAPVAPPVVTPTPAPTVQIKSPEIATPTVVVPVPVEPAPVPPVTVTAPAVKVTKSEAKFSEINLSGDDTQEAKMREALRQQIAATPAAVAPPTATGVTVVTPSKPVVPAAPKAPTVVVQYPPVEAIPSPFAATKQQRLAELLGRYKADTITPQEYHTQRAAIIAE